MSLSPSTLIPHTADIEIPTYTRSDKDIIADLRSLLHVSEANNQQLRAALAFKENEYQLLLKNQKSGVIQYPADYTISPEEMEDLRNKFKLKYSNKEYTLPFPPFPSDYLGKIIIQPEPQPTVNDEIDYWFFLKLLAFLVIVIIFIAVYLIIKHS